MNKNSFFNSFNRMFLGLFALGSLSLAIEGLVVGEWWGGLGLVLLMSALIGNLVYWNRANLIKPVASPADFVEKSFFKKSA